MRNDANRQNVFAAAKLLLAAAAVLSAVLVIVQLLWICRSGSAAGTQMYTPEVVASAFHHILPILCIFGLLSAILIIAGMLLPLGNEKQPKIAVSTRLEFLLSRKEKTEEMLREEKKRRFIKLYTAIFIVCCLAAMTWAVFSAGSFTEEGFHKEMVYAMPFLIISMFAAFAAAWAAMLLLDRSRIRECDLAKAAPSGRSTAVAAGGKGLTAARLFLLLAAIVFIILGVFNGGMHDVLVKAANICTECIGLG